MARCLNCNVSAVCGSGLERVTAAAAITKNFWSPPGVSAYVQPYGVNLLLVSLFSVQHFYKQLVCVEDASIAMSLLLRNVEKPQINVSYPSWEQEKKMHFPAENPYAFQQYPNRMILLHRNCQETPIAFQNQAAAAANRGRVRLN
ncbi:hypothetical protein ACLOJK_038066 [Asimina triloba]